MNTRVAELFHEIADLSVEARARYFVERGVEEPVRDEVEALLAFDSDSSISLATNIDKVAQGALDRFEPPLLPCGPYRLLRLLGRGGMGSVYLAERADGEIVQQVAVKLLRPGADDPDMRRRFLTERQILATLSHPNIARLLDAGHREDGQPYLVMEYIEGTNIDAYAAQCTVTEKLALFVKVCGAVAYLHRNLVVHRDLKPSNILVTRDGEPMILDFGISKMLDLTTDTTITNLRRLTPDYASPEQAAGGTVTTVADIYSLGAVLYKLLTGDSPHRFEGIDPGSIESAISSGIVIRPSTRLPSLKGDLEAILLKAMRKSPQERYATMEQFSEDLENYLGSRPVRARNDDHWYRTKKFLRRHWLPVTAGLVAITGLTAGLFAAHRERIVAERRFAEVRQLANQLFAVEDDISRVVGTTKARERIVKTALTYLEKLSRDAGDDLQLKTEIASAYTKVANIQGGFRSTNLGRPADARDSLQKAEAFFHAVVSAKPKDPLALHNLLEAIELKSRIEYGQLNAKGLENASEQLRALAVEYEPVAPATVEERDFLGGVFQTMALSARRLDDREHALEWSARSIDYQKKAAAVSTADPIMGHLSASLSAYGKLQRARGDLQGALGTFKETLRIAERLATRNPNDNRTQINLAADYSDLAVLYADENGISLGDKKEAAKWYELALAVGRHLVRADPQETQIRHNTAASAWHYANVIRSDDPKRANVLYEEAIDLLRSMPAKAGGRDLYLGIVLAESAVPLRRLGRNAEASERLAEAKQIAQATRHISPTSPGMPSEAIARAEADWAMRSGHPAEAAAIHQAWLEELHFGNERVQKDLHGALIFAFHYELLRDAHRKAGNPEAADAAEARRRAILSFWRDKVPDPSFIESRL